MELLLEDMEATNSEDLTQIEADAATDVATFARSKPVRAPISAHLPLNRQSENFAREGNDLDIPSPAGRVGACSATLVPLVTVLRTHVLTGGRLHGDDTTVPVLVNGKISTGRLWVYVRGDRPFGDRAPPAALFHASPDRTEVHRRNGRACCRLTPMPGSMT